MPATPQYWAFAETVERTATHVRARLDLLPGADLARVVGLPPDQRNDALARLHPPVLTIDAHGNSRDDLLRRAAGGLRESSWYRLQLGRAGVPARLHAAIDALESVPVLVEQLERVDGRSAEGRLLRSVFGLEDCQQAELADVAALLAQVQDHADLRVGVYDVGQGNANAVCDAANMPLMYFDLGGGCAWNASTYATRKPFCWTHSPPIVLSHWDFDHYFSGTFLQDSWRQRWLVPSQGTIGPTPRKMLSNITLAGGTVLVWSQGPWTATAGPLTLARPAPNSTSKNHSGLVLRAELPDPASGGTWPVLLTGDISYNHLQGPIGLGVRALVAGHHGASRYMGTPPVPAGGGKVAYSFGNANTYGHPTAAAIQRHATQGWVLRRDTPSGNIVFAPVPALHPVGCGGPMCGLNPVQQ